MSEAAFARDGQELIVTPPTGIAAGTRFTVRVRYKGRARDPRRPERRRRRLDPDRRRRLRGRRVPGHADLVSGQRRPGGQGDLRIRRRRARGRHGDGQRRPALAQDRQRLDDVALGRGRPDVDVPRHRHAGALRPDRVRDRRHPDLRRRRPAALQGQRAEQAARDRALLLDLYGPYPFNAAGAIVDDAPGVGYALETQTKPFFDACRATWTLVHETAHMWYGDSVTLKDWPDIWLNEGFATWSNWIWSEAQGNKSAHSAFKANYSSRSAWLWSLPTGDSSTPETCSTGGRLPARRDDPAGAAREDRRRRGLLRHHAHLGRRQPPRDGHDAAVRRPRRGEERHGSWTTSSGCGCTSPEGRRW